MSQLTQRQHSVHSSTDLITVTSISARCRTCDITKKLTNSPIEEWNAVAQTSSHPTPARHLAEVVSVDREFLCSGRRAVPFGFIPEQTASLLRVQLAEFRRCHNLFVLHVHLLLGTLELPVWFVSANRRHIVRRMYVELDRNKNGVVETIVGCDRKRVSTARVV